MQLRDFGRMASGNSRILDSLRFRVVKLTKALKPEKSAQKRVQVSAQASDIRIFALTASAVSASSWRLRGRGARARTCEELAAVQAERHERGAVRKHIQRSCGSHSRSIGRGVRGFKLVMVSAVKCNCAVLGVWRLETHGYW